jgi:hypothetical protein
MDDKPLYDDSFLKLSEWLNSGVLVLILGCSVSVFLLIYVHWVLSLVAFVATIFMALASFIVLKK